MKGYKPYRNEWADSYLRTKVWIFPASVLLPIALWLVFFSWKAFYTMIVGAIGLFLLEKMGITFGVLLLSIRSKLAGRVIKRRRCLLNKTIE